MSRQTPDRGARLGAALVAVTVGLAGGMLVGLLTTPALACSCVALTDEEAFARADVVFTGSVVDYREPLERSSSADLAIWVFHVHDVHKGAVSLPRQEVASAVSGASCGLELPGGRGTYLVHADDTGDDAPGGTLTASLCGGTHPVAALPIPDQEGADGPAGRQPDDQGGLSVDRVALVAAGGAVLALVGLGGLMWRRSGGSRLR